MTMPGGSDSLAAWQNGRRFWLQAAFWRAYNAGGFFSVARLQAADAKVQKSESSAVRRVFAMGVLVYPILRTPIPELSSRTTGEFLAREFKELDQIADEHGMKSFTSFADQRPVPPDFDGPPWELDDLLGPCEDWFAASAGKSAFTALAQLIRNEAAVSHRLKSPE